jgi:glycosyltransferase involved in cell wall biosynthesis
VENFKVSIICITYNHKNFIRQTLDGFVMQKTNFPFQAIIHDDASTDGTTEIIKEYEKKYPHIIKPVYQTENQWSLGIDFKKKYMFPLVNGEYAAFCEGDDYWTDSRKLQLQADFLDKNKDFSICFHPVKVVWDGGEKKTVVFPRSRERWHKKEFTFEDLKKKYLIQTCSAMYRWDKHLAQQRPSGVLPGDYFWHLLFTQNGKKAGFINRVMAVYRRHAGGVWSNITEENVMKYAFPRMKFYHSMAEMFYASDASYVDKNLLPFLSRVLSFAAVRRNYAIIDGLFALYPQYFEMLKNTPLDFFLLRQRLNRAVKQRKIYLIGFIISALIAVALLFLKL